MNPFQKGLKQVQDKKHKQGNIHCYSLKIKEENSVWPQRALSNDS
jgi:hypothetical protein